MTELTDQLHHCIVKDVTAAIQTPRPRLVEIKPLPNDKLFVRFADGVQGLYDVCQLLGMPVLQRLWKSTDVGKAYAALVKIEAAYNEKPTVHGLTELVETVETLHSSLVEADDPRDRKELRKLKKELDAMRARIDERVALSTTKKHRPRMRKRNKADESKYSKLKGALKEAERNIRMGNIVPVEALPSYARYRKLKTRDQ